MEHRDLRFQCDVRAASGEDGNIITSTIPTNRPTNIGPYQENLAPGVFGATLASGANISALDSHDPSKPLASTKAGTLRLKELSDGLHIEIQLDRKITRHNDLYLSVRRGDYGGMSFGFTVPPGGERWDGDIRTLTKINLLEVSPVTFPAYDSTSISTRNNMNTNNQSAVTLSAHEYRAFRQYCEESINEPPGQTITIEDAPVYRGAYPLGQQMVDVFLMSRPGGVGANEARSRHEQMVTREKALAEKRAAGTGGMVMATGQDGGLLLQGETSMDMIKNGFNNSAVLSRCSKRDLGFAQFVELVGIDETSRTDASRGGGCRVYNDAELSLIMQSKTKFDKIRLEPKRLTGMYFASNEILENAPILQSEMEQLFNEEFAFKGQDLAVNGSGAGEGLGVLKSPCLVTVAAEVNQGAATILFENLVKMKARILARSRSNLVWIANQDIEAQLFTLALPIGTGGAVMPVYIPSTNQGTGVDGTLLGIPIVFIEQCATLGTVGDIILGDWSSYLAASKGGIQAASSIHLKFDYNQTAFRFVTYFDGQPRLKSAITPYKGAATTSPFVALATR